MKNTSNRKSLALALALLLAVPALAVFNEKDLGQTISVLRSELKQEYSKISGEQESILASNREQREQMISMMKKCNELALMLYSQNQDYTFDMTYALKEVTREYEEFNQRKTPYDQMVQNLDIEIDRYSRLVESLRRLPPQLDDVSEVPDSLAYHNDSLNFEGFRRPSRGGRGAAGAGGRHESEHRHGPEYRNTPENVPSTIQVQEEDETPVTLAGELLSEMFSSAQDDEEDGRPFVLDSLGRANRDSCIHYAAQLLKMYQRSKDKVVADSLHYRQTSLHLKESYDYATNRYQSLQNQIVFQSQGSYFSILANIGSYSSEAFGEARDKYSRNFSDDGTVNRSEWRGPIVIGFMGLVLLYIAIAAVLSVIVINFLRRKVKLLQSEEVRKKEICLTMLCAMVIFAITVWVASSVLTNNFFKVAAELLLIYAWFVAAILLSLYIRLKPGNIRNGMRLYTPMMVTAIVVITFRVVFIPNKMMSLLFPPILALAFVWQLLAVKRNHARVEKIDRVIGWTSVVVLALTAIVSWTGYVFLSVLAVIWWLFQLAAIETVMAISTALHHYDKKHLAPRLAEEKKKASSSGQSTEKGDFIAITWLYDLIDKTIMPVVAVVSVPLCIWLALDVFDLAQLCDRIIYGSFFNLTDASGATILHVSLYKIVLTVSLFYVFRYLSYSIKAFYKIIKLEQLRSSSGRSHIPTNEINLTLANNVIGILVWGVYCVVIVVLLKIPLGALSVILAGLATGLGLAMKDILNNFIYGIQLMSGRLRVGDWVECDGVRGKVTAISYQSTQIETSDGAVMSFLNTSLFNKNFKNLTRNNAYEFVKIVVGVGYGSKVEEVREMLLRNLAAVQTKDRYGRNIVDLKRGVSVAFEEFGDSSVDLAVKQYVLVSERAAYIAAAKEVIYNTLNANNIEIPFPQRDVYVKVVKND